MWLELSEVARLEELRQARALAEVADTSEPLCGGVMSRGIPGSWHNNASGIGLSGPVTKDDVARLIDFYASAGCEPHIEVCPFVDPSLISELAAAGFGVRAFEMVFFRALDPGHPARPVHGTPAGVELSFIDSTDAAAVREYALVATSGFFPPGHSLPEEFLEIVMRTVRRPHSKGAVAKIGGRIVGAGGVGITGEIAALFGLSVVPEFRRRGIQQALIAHRLNEAAANGVKVATIGGRPGQGTERNVRRMGFELAYTKIAMTRPGPGLKPMME